MAKKAVVVDQKADVIESLGEFSRFKNMDRATLMSVLEDVFRSMIRKKYGSDENFNVIVNVDKGDLQAYRERTIVSDHLIEDESKQISLSEALQIDEDFKEGEIVGDAVSFVEFGRRQIMAAKQLLAQRIKELEKQLVFDQYKALEGEVIIGEVYQVWRNEILVVHEENELTLPKSEQIPKDKFKKGDSIRAVVLEVTMRNSLPKILLSRTAPIFLEKLFEKEVPEIADGTIVIRKTVREPGERAKIIVESFDDRIDPVGACVGMRGSRIHGVVRELRNENIDVINFTGVPQILIQRALTPARVSNIEIDETHRQASVYLKGDQLSLAIGKGGVNVRLASKLTGYEIDVIRETGVIDIEEDVDLEEFKDEIDDWIIAEFQRVGFDTAKSILRVSADDLEHRTDLDRSTIQEVIEVLSREFEE